MRATATIAVFSASFTAAGITSSHVWTLRVEHLWTLRVEYDDDKRIISWYDCRHDKTKHEHRQECSKYLQLTDLPGGRSI
ncbi:hypothetical protein CY34DRAFT_803405 [Suillus luteus UH-Slu-Lm8-n1]|uniref:Uncharacterized protein n=1 Tax=Suillus luteus UH-Slu-Lm8-n1 TaxID=930992 RepID=A0A0D0A1F9_9AGAM|nr:hypothetical protein CY34DRAFT_803405 [Suillus luteus UH-Slu-Lm8-n1]